MNKTISIKPIEYILGNKKREFIKKIEDMAKEKTIEQLEQAWKGMLIAAT